MEKEVCTIREVANKLNYSERQIRQKCIDGKLNGAYKIAGGNKWLIPRQAFEALSNNPSVQAAQQKASTINKPYEETVHKKKIRELANELKEEIVLPDILRIERIPSKLSIDSKGQSEHLYQGLRCHLETEGFSEVLTEIGNWKKELKKYLNNAQNLLTFAQSQIKVQSNIPDDEIERNEKTGYKELFFRTACNDAVRIAEGIEPATASQERYYRNSLTNNLWLLGRYFAGGIYVGQDIEEIEQCQSVHHDLAETLAKSDYAKKAAELYKNLLLTSNYIKQKLQEYIDMECLPGYCKLCNPSGKK